MVETHNTDDFIWAQKYRPRKVEDCVLPDATMDMVKGLLSKQEIPHMIFNGGPGMGKTTLAYAIADELGSDVMYINASLENGIDVLRTKIQSFASTTSLSDSGPKIVILDEADGLTGVLQNALKGFLEAFSANCRFIFTSNHRNKIIEPIQSRCTVIDFKVVGKERAKLAQAMLKRVTEILKLEGIGFDIKVVAEVISKNFPDFRRTLNTIQRYSVVGSIDSGILVDLGDENFKELMGSLKAKNFTEVRKWIAKNSDIDTPTLYRYIYDSANSNLEGKSIPQLIVILAEYQYKSAFVADTEINNMACMTEIMSSCSFLDQ